MAPKKPVAPKPGARAPAKPASKPAAGKKPVAAAAKPAGKPGAKKPAPAKGKAAAPPAKPVEKKWTKEDDAARKIQTQVRGYLARKKVQRKKKEKQEYEELMERLEKEAFVKLVKMEQEEAERQRLKEAEERKRKAEMKKRRKRMLEGAYDGDNDEIMTILREVSEVDDKAGVSRDTMGQALRNKHQQDMINCEDANANTPLSEAGSGGHAETIKLLIEKGADPNTKGQFDRTPLYRAAFAGHLEACQTLLQYGADPRIYASDGQIPEQIASIKSIEALLQEWDITQTESLLVKIEADKEKRAEEDKKRREAQITSLETSVEDAQREYKIQQKKLMKLTQELNKRITEHDTAVGEGFARPDVTLQAIHDAEADVEIARIDAEKARDTLAMAKLQLREQQAQDQVAMGEELPGLQVVVRELDDVLLRDVGNKIMDSGKWPLIIDSSGQAATFLRYRDTNYMNALKPADMEPEKIRMALLGAIRYGKPLILDMMEVDMMEAVQRRFDEIQQDLLAAVMDQSIIKNEKYLSLLKPTDPDEYHKNRFNEMRTSNFRFFIVTKNPFPDEALLDVTYPIRVVVPTE